MKLIPLAFLLLISCSNTVPVAEESKPRHDERPSFTIAILPEQNVFEQKKRYRPLADYLSRALGLHVKIKLLDSYGSIYEEIKDGTIDAAFFGSFNYVLAKAQADIEPIARPVKTNGIANYRGVIFTRRDSGLTGNVGTWKGRRIALIHEDTTAGYIFPKWYLSKNGISEFDHYFSKIIFAGSHDAAVLSVLKGQADIGAAKDIIYDQLLLDNPALKKELVILARSIEVPSNSLCVRGNVNKTAREALLKTLLSLHTTEEGSKALRALDAVRFQETTDNEFDGLRSIARDLSMDLKSQQFRRFR